jgi:hypothetical protein
LAGGVDVAVRPVEPAWHDYAVGALSRMTTISREILRVTRTLTLLAAFLGVAAAAGVCTAATSSPIDEAFGNTVVSTYPDGRTAELWLAPDGSYTGQGRRHDPSSGHWKVKGAELCLKESRPTAFPFSFCTPLPSRGFGAPWAGKAPTGEVTQIKLVHGHVTGG